jgi:hypothetical protein
MSVVLPASYDSSVDIAYVNPIMDAASDYPTLIGPTILPEVWAPRLYAKGLNTLELASSGRVAVTTNDKHALDIVVAEHPDVEHDHTYLKFANDGFTLSSKLQDVLVTLPSTETAGVNDTMLTSNNVDVVATEAITLTGATLNADFAENASISAPAVDVTASAGDIVFSAGNNLTLTVKEDRIVVKGDIDIEGTINSSTVVTVETSKITDNYIDIQDGMLDEVTGGSLGSQAGLRIQTSPDGDTASFGDPLDTYLRKFKSSDAEGRTFYTGNVFDAAKYNLTNYIFNKGVLYNVNQGYGAGGYKTETSRSEEPYWDVSGGAMRVSRVVPSASDDLVYRVAISFRVTNLGELEIVQHRTPLHLINGTYVAGVREPAKVLSLMGHVPSV